MDLKIEALVLRALNDGMSSRPYGHGALLDLPMTYSDGDSIRVFVEELGKGYRVSDRGDAIDRLVEAGVNPDAVKARAAIEDALRTHSLDRIASEDRELSAFCDMEDFGATVLAVAQSAIRVEQLRWLVQRPRELKFLHRVKSVLYGGDWAVRTDAPVKLRSGRTRRVTASVRTVDATVLVQALGSKERAEQERSLSNAFFTFSQMADREQFQRLTVFGGTRDAWPRGVDEDMAPVSDVLWLDETSDAGFAETVSQLAARPLAKA